MSDIKYYEYFSSKNPQYLVILLHGYGSNGENLLSLHHEFKYALENAHYISPNAIEPWEGGMQNAYQWFSLASWGSQRSVEIVAENIKKSNDILRKFIENKLKALNLSQEKLFLVGFSQGAMMSMYQALSSEKRVGGVISFSGKLILPENVGEKTISKPEMCLIHGKLDSVLPFYNLIEAENSLSANKIPYESHAFDNLDHTIDIHGIRVAINFIKKQINK